jgi:hypothetical protein
MLSDEEMYARMAKGWRGGIPDGTICGQGSTRKHTRVVSEWLPVVCDKYGIKSVCDAGAGDLHWIRDVKWSVDYRPFDLIPRGDDVEKIDITTEVLPNCDAILCRMVLNHLVDGDDHGRVIDSIVNFRQSADYLIATNFVEGSDLDRAFQRLDLRGHLGEPLESTIDGHAKGCRLSLWRL